MEGNTNNFPSLTYEYLHSMPKIELHAHLNGCFRFETLKELSLLKGHEFPFDKVEKIDLTTGFALFEAIHKVLNDLKSISRITREMLEDFSSENTVYLEIRTTPKALKGVFTEEDYLKTILDEFLIFTSQNAQMIIKLILSVDRSQSIEKAEKTLEILEKLKKNSLYEQYMIGLDYSGNPYKGSFKDFEHVFQNARKLGFKTFLHIAETELKISKEESLDILRFKPDRLGHFNYFDEELLEFFLKQKVPLEICPSSNCCTLKLDSLKKHHFGKLHKFSHTMSICTDDPGIFQTTLTKEIFEIITNFGINFPELVTFLKNSLDCIPDLDSRKAVKIKWEEYFKVFF